MAAGIRNADLEDPLDPVTVGMISPLPRVIYPVFRWKLSTGEALSITMKMFVT